MLEIDPALKMTFKDDPVVEGHIEMNGNLYVIVQKSGRFHVLGVNQQWFESSPERVTNFAGIAQVYHHAWNGLFYASQIDGLKTWNIIQTGDDRRNYIQGVLNEVKPLAIASPTSFGQYVVESTMVMLVEPSMAISKK